MENLSSADHPRTSRDLPPFPWREVSGPYLTSVIDNIPKGPFARNAQAAETARAVSGWRNDQTKMPSANSGFHAGFIRNTQYRKEVRERLILNIRDSVRGHHLLQRIHSNFTHIQIAALERCCGVGCLLVVFQGEQGPALAQIPASLLTLDERNVRLITGELFQINPSVFSPAIGDIRDVCLRQLGIAYMQDFRTRADKSCYFANVPLEPETPTKSLILRPSSPVYDSEFPVEAVTRSSDALHTPRLRSPSPSKSRLASNSGRSHPIKSVAWAPKQEPTPVFQVDHSVHSQFSSMRLSNASPSRLSPHPSPASAVRHNQDTPTYASDSHVGRLPSEVLDLLTAMGEGDATHRSVFDVYHHVPRSSQEAALAGLGFSPGMSKALAFLMQ